MTLLVQKAFFNDMTIKSRMKKIESKKAYIVPFDIDHAKSRKYLKWLQDYEIIKTLNLLSYIEKKVSQKQLEDYFVSLNKDQSCKFFALYEKEKDTFIGTVKVSKIDLKLGIADIGIMIGEKIFWGKGIAQDILQFVCIYCFDKYNLRKLTCGLMSNNIAMRKVFEKLGFRQEGRFRKVDLFEGDYIDHIYMGCFKNEMKRTNIT